MRLWPQRLPELVAGLAQLEVGADELAKRLRLSGLLLSFPRFTNHVLAKPGLSQDHGRLFADVGQSARHEGPKGLASLLCADAVLDAEGCVSARLLPDTEPGQRVVEYLHLLCAIRNLQSTDQLIGEFGHVGLHFAERKSDVRRAAICVQVLGESERFTQDLAGV